MHAAWLVLSAVVGCSSDAAGPGDGDVESIAITPSSATVAVGANLTLNAEVRDGVGQLIAGRPVTWSSEDETIATVSPSGVVTGRKVGVVMIAASTVGKDAFSEVTVNPTPVSFIRLSHNNRSMRVGETFQLTAEALDAGGRVLSGRPIIWITSNASVATVTGDGLVTAVAPGGAVITASAEGKSEAASISVSLVPVASVTITPSVDDIVVGQNTQLTVEVKDATGAPLTGRVVAWSTSLPGVATVSSSGLVTANAAGSATITASSEGRSGTATINVTPRPVSSVIVSPGQVSLIVGQTRQLTISITDDRGQLLIGRPISFSSDNAQVVTVSSSGLLTGVSAGNAKITATSEGKTGTADVTVTPVPVAGVEVTPSQSSIIVGHGVQLTAIPKDAAGQPLTGRIVSWRSGAPGLASVSSSGMVTGLQIGTAVIIATVDGIAGSATVQIRPVPVATVTVTPSTASLTAGQTVTLSATLQDASGNTLTGRPLSWSSSDNTIATVTSAGDVTGVGTGVATISATSEGQVGTATVTVGMVPVASVTVTPPNATVDVGATVQLGATPRDAAGNPLAGRNVTWSSSADAIATVSSGGVVTGVTQGVVTITATVEGQSGSSTVTVNAAGPPPPVPVASVSVSPSTVSLTVGSTQSVTATPLDANGNPLAGRVITWSSGNSNVATVNSSGLITATGVGNTTVQATSEGQSGVVTVNVAAASIASITISPSSTSVNVGWTTALTATPRDANGNPMAASVSWSTSDASVAVVSSSGVVTGVSVGSATITASSGSGTGTATISVQLAPVNRVVVTPANPEVRERQSVQLTATLYDAKNNVLSGRSVTWTSADPNKVSVTSTGLATGVRKGTVTVTATSEGVSGSTDVKVR
jgi:uncharacterized protein YjdB